MEKKNGNLDGNEEKKCHLVKMSRELQMMLGAVFISECLGIVDDDDNDDLL